MSQIEKWKNLNMVESEPSVLDNKCIDSASILDGILQLYCSDGTIVEITPKAKHSNDACYLEIKSNLDNL